MIKLIIFDLDDTLYKEKDYVRSWFNVCSKYIAEKFNLSEKEVFDELMFSFKNHWRWKNFNHIVLKFKLPYDELMKLVKIYQKHLPDIQLKKSVVEWLKKLKEKFQIVILTNAEIQGQKNKVEALWIWHIVDKIYYASAEWSEFEKPHERFFLKILKDFKLNKDEVIMVGDDLEADIGGAHNVWIKSLHTSFEKIESTFNILNNN